MAPLPPKTRYIPGGRVVLADGTYNLGAKVTMTRQNTHLMGMGDGTHLRPTSSMTGDRLIEFGHHHCRVSRMLLIDRDDDDEGIQYVTWAGASVSLGMAVAWPVVESVHTRGGEFGFFTNTGPAVYQCENHPTRSPAVNAGLYGVRFDDTVGGRIHGGVYERVRRHGILVSGTSFSMDNVIEGVLVNRASQDVTGSYNGIYLSSSTDSAVMGCSVVGNDHQYGVRVDDTCDKVGVLGNRLEDTGNTADLSVNGATNLSAANYADGVIK